MLPKWYRLICNPMNRYFVPLDYPVENLSRKKTNKPDVENFPNFRSASFSLGFEQFSRPLEYWSPKERNVSNKKTIFDASGRKYR